MLNVSFLGNNSETAGSVSETNTPLKTETTGSVSTKPQYYNSAANTNKTLNADTVCFRSHNYERETSGSETALKVFGVATGAALAIAGLGYAHKVNAVEKLNEGKLKEFLRHTYIITEPCHKICSNIKHFVQKHDKLFDWLSWII